MKRIGLNKKIMFFLFFSFLCCPFVSKAASISSVTMPAIEQQQTGNVFTVPIKVSVSGVSQSSETEGIYVIVYSLSYDTSILELMEVSSDWYYMEVKTDGTNYYILAYTSDTTEDKCSDGFLSCYGDTTIYASFHVTSNVKESTNIVLNEVGVGVYDIDDTLESYTGDNMKEVYYSKPVTLTVPIKKTETVVQEKPKSEMKPTIKYDQSLMGDATKKVTPPTTTPKVDTQQPSIVTYSNNTFLKSLSIESHVIDFKKDVEKYVITIKEDETSLKVIAEAEDLKSKVQVIGAEKLKDEVKIIVKAENGEERTYLIELKKEKKKEIIKEEETKKEKKFTFKKKWIKPIAIGGGIVLFIGFIIFILKIRSDKKLDKDLNKFL